MDRSARPIAKRAMITTGTISAPQTVKKSVYLAGRASTVLSQSVQRVATQNTAIVTWPENAGELQ